MRWANTCSCVGYYPLDSDSEWELHWAQKRLAAEKVVAAAAAKARKAREKAAREAKERTRKAAEEKARLEAAWAFLHNFARGLASAVDDDSVQRFMLLELR